MIRRTVDASHIPVSFTIIEPSRNSSGPYTASISAWGGEPLWKMTGLDSGTHYVDVKVTQSGRVALEVRVVNRFGQHYTDLMHVLLNDDFDRTSQWIIAGTLLVGAIVVSSLHSSRESSIFG